MVMYSSYFPYKHVKSHRSVVNIQLSLLERGGAGRDLLRGGLNLQNNALWLSGGNYYYVEWRNF